VLVDGVPRTIVGVARPEFRLPDVNFVGAQVWTPFVVPPPDPARGHEARMTVLWALGRLRNGVTPTQAEAEGMAAARGLV
jgi:hypothetical protein